MLCYAIIHTLFDSKRRVRIGSLVLISFHFFISKSGFRNFFEVKHGGFRFACS